MSAKNLGSLGVLFTDRRQFYLNPQVTKELWGDVAPFTTIISNRAMNTGLQDPTYKLFEHRSSFVKQYFLQNDATPTTITTAGATVTIDGIVGLASTPDSSYVGLQVEIWDTTNTTLKGRALITAVVSSTELTIKSLDGASIATADNDIFYVIGNAFGEGTEAAEAWADELTTVWNSTQIFKTPVEITGTLYEAALRGYSNELARLRMEKAKEHKIQKERAFLFGGSPVGTNMNGSGTFDDGFQTDANSKKVRTTYGLLTAINTYGKTSGDDQNIFSIDSSTYSWSDFVDDMEKVFQYVPENGSKTAICGGGALSYWSKLEGSKFLSGNSGWNIQISDMKRDSLGFNYRMLETPHGILKLVWAPVLRGPRNGYMVVLSDENLSLNQYRPMKFETNIKTDNAYDGVKDQYFSDEGVGIQLIETHKLFKIS